MQIHIDLYISTFSTRRQQALMYYCIIILNQKLILTIKTRLSDSIIKRYYNDRCIDATFSPEQLQTAWQNINDLFLLLSHDEIINACTSHVHITSESTSSIHFIMDVPWNFDEMVSSDYEIQERFISPWRYRWSVSPWVVYVLCLCRLKSKWCARSLLLENKSAPPIPIWSWRFALSPSHG